MAHRGPRNQLERGVSEPGNASPEQSVGSLQEGPWSLLLEHAELLACAATGAALSGCGGGGKDDADAFVPPDAPATDAASPVDAPSSLPDANSGPDAVALADAAAPDATPPDATPICPAGATDTEITGNHGHSLVVPQADIEAALDKAYDIQGTSQHPHSITLTGAHFASLAAGMSVTVVSTVHNGHDHDVTAICA